MIGNGITILPLSHYLPRPFVAASWLLAICLLLAAAVSRGLGRLFRHRPGRLPAVLVPGLAILLGWGCATGLALPPHGAVARLAGAEIIALPAALWLDRLGSRSGFWPVLAIFALVTGWWLADAPAGWPEAAARVAPIAAAAACTGVLAGVLATSDAWTLAVAATGLATALHAVGAPPPWPLLACIPLAACLTGAPPPAPALPGRRRRARSMPAPPPTPRRLLIVGLAVALVAAGATASAIESRAHGLAVAAAALVPLASPWLVAALRTRLRWLGPGANAAAAVLGLATLALIALSAAALAGLR